MSDTTFDVSCLPCGSIKPDNKDYERALHLAWQNDPSIPETSKAEKMSKLIKDPIKLVRRSKAVVCIWGTCDYHNDYHLKMENVWAPFERALIAMGFNQDQIQEIEDFEIDEEDL
jgi:hypothetical protein